MAKVLIVTDSASDISYEDEKLYGIKVLPFKIALGDRSYISRVDFDNEKFYELTRFISNKMVSEYGQTFFKKILATAPESIRSAAVETFAYNTLEGMRYSIAYCLWNEFRTEEGFQMPEVGTPTENAGVYTLKCKRQTNR